MTNNSKSPRHSIRVLRPVGTAALVAVAVVLLGISGCATAPTGAPEQKLDFPSPVSGPGLPALDKDPQRSLEEGWQALRRGDTVTAGNSARQAGTGPASRLLEFQSALVAGNPPVEKLNDLVETVPDYAAAWLTLSVAAERENNESLALRAAERGAVLWPDKRWVDRSQSLHRRWIDDRIDSAATLYEEGDAKTALRVVSQVIGLDPDNRDAVLLQARSLIAVNELDQAEAVLAGLSRDRDVVLLSGSIAESRGDTSAALRIYSSLEDDPEATLMAIALAEGEERWQTVMDLYSSLPDSQPEKARGLNEAKLRWRVSVMPEYVREALSTDDMNRSDLAVMIVALVPKVETLPSKQVPLLSDIVDMPSQREIVTAARLGLIDIDRMEHRFHPTRSATAEEARSAISNLGTLLGIPEPPWCSDGSTTPCVSFVQPIAGESVAGVIIDMVTGEGS